MGLVIELVIMHLWCHWCVNQMNITKTTVGSEST